MKPRMQWTVERGDGDVVGTIVERMRALGGPERARVFLNGRRAELDDPVDPGDRVELWPLAEPGPDEEVQVLAQRDGVLAVYKPAGLPTETTRQGEDSLLSRLMEQINSAGVHAASRLDVGVSGVLLCTLGRDAARRLSRWRRDEQHRRIYLAIAQGTPPEAGSWSQPLGKLRDRAGRHKASPHATSRRPAHTDFRVLARTGEASLLELVPRTGRMHQLRAHAALAGAPLYGDALYGGPRSAVDGSGKVIALDRIALHAHRVQLPSLGAEAPVPEGLRELWRSLGGSDGDWPAG